jgi:hypothetical protein
MISVGQDGNMVVILLDFVINLQTKILRTVRNVALFLFCIFVFKTHFKCQNFNVWQVHHLAPHSRHLWLASIGLCVISSFVLSKSADLLLRS